MLQQLTNVRRQTGISLLELMLSLAIIAVILTMATRFYTQANQNQKINDGISMVTGLIGGANSWMMSTPNINITKLSDLIKSGYVPTSFGGASGEGVGANPWAGDIVVSSTNQVANITLTNIPTPQCENIVTRFKSDYDTTSSACATGTFELRTVPKKS